jgi:diguanylate cyclase (GGDEF)-like protein
MRTRRSTGERASSAAVTAWPIWRLPRWLASYIVGVTVVYIAAIAAAVPVMSVTPHDLLLCGALLLCVAATVELTKRVGENAGLIRDVYAVWELPLAILLPPAYALMAPIFRLALTQWRIRRIPVHRRVFSAAIVGLSYGSASLVFRMITSGSMQSPTLSAAHASLLTHASAWVLAVALAGVVQWTVNTALLLPAIKGSDPTARVRDLLLAREHADNDIAEICVAVLVTLGIAVTSVTIVFAFPFVTLLQRSFRHAFLVNASRLDAKTGLLNAGTWEREASSEVARAIRTRSPLAVALIDVDHFKSVNDAYGHLVGDKALKAIAHTLSVFLREYDLAGRFGGEEFALLLPQTKPVDAYRIAERIRGYIAAMPIDVDGDPGAEPVTVTVSIGVAALGNHWDTGVASQLTDLVAAADAALYRAKRGGRDQVCVVTEKATFVGQPDASHGQPKVPGSPPPKVPPSDGSDLSSPEPAGSQA